MGSNNTRQGILILLGVGIGLATGTASAEAGRVMYVSGQANLIRGSELPIAKGTVVEAGDTLVTGADGRIQLLMADGDRIALRPDTRFRIDEFTGPSRTKPGEAVAGARPSSWRSFYTLAKGGLRTLTHSQGERDASSYQVRTLVATIGIRGTDYSAHFGPENCKGESAGGAGCLVAGVSAGAIRLFNDKGDIVLGDSQFGYVPGTDTTPLQLSEPPESLQDPSDSTGEGKWEEQVSEGEGEGDNTEEAYSARTSPTEGESGDSGSEDESNAVASGGTVTDDPTDSPEQSIEASDATGNPVDLSGGSAPVFGVAFAGGPAPDATGAASNDIDTVTTDSTGLVAFKGPFAGSMGQYEIGTAQNANAGDDSATGLRWGRWNGGIATVTQNGTPQNITLDADGQPNGQSLHWIMGPSAADAPALPTTGTVSYVLVGNTEPTDNHGNTGTMTADFSADFDMQKVYSDVFVGIDSTDQNWEAHDTSGTPISSDGTFAGDYDSVIMMDIGTCSSGCSGSGDYAGFLTGGGQGAGMGYSLEQGGTTVTGVGAFEQQ